MLSVDKLDKFYALSAPVRREIITLLSEGDQLTASAIADKFSITPPAISQHLKVLLDSKLVRMHKNAQQRIYELNPVALLEVESWAGQMLGRIKETSGLVENKPNPSHRGGK
jgi:DNA-binding transcriptional ArsR family regulator